MFYTMDKKYHYAMPTIKYFKVIEEGFKDWRGNKKLLLNSCIHSIVNHTENGYKSKNWKDKAYINNSFLKKNFRKAF